MPHCCRRKARCQPTMLIAIAFIRESVAIHEQGVCDIGCESCGYNWYEQHWNNGDPTSHWDAFCGCCQGIQAQQDVCKTVCVSHAQPPSAPNTPLPPSAPCYSTGGLTCVHVDPGDSWTNFALFGDEVHMTSTRRHDVWKKRSGSLMLYANAPPAPWVATAQMRCVQSPNRTSGPIPRNWIALTAYQGPDNGMPPFMLGPQDWNIFQTTFWQVTRWGEVTANMQPQRSKKMNRTMKSGTTK